MTWDYRILFDGKSYKIIEVYYNDQGEPDGYVEPAYPEGETIEELKDDLEAYRRALDLAVLTPADMAGSQQPDQRNL